ncbi:GGDEF domain-containing protein [Lentzea tibetensis]|uniref:GGDEF domain-containing protein n=1 Tax=Lentzea tibetensis TaxID=2591470 RepID=A0A563EWX8_9PSEU|nr:GGDEF domain-containing protein [Lentzea tibetensis]TWP52163.1 GGDEF domain-containing protein [Lentzea tibetensis]
MTLRRFTVVAAAVGAVLVATVVLVVSGVLGRDASVAVDKIEQLVFAVAALACYARTAKPRWRRWMVAAMASLTVGLSAWIWGQQVLSVQLPSSTLAPLGFLLVPVLTLAAVIVLAHSGGRDDRPHDRRSRLVVVIDGLVIVGSLFVLTWVSALESMVRAWATSGPGFVTVVAHPALYLVTIVSLVVSSWTHRSIRQLPMLFITLAGIGQSASGWVFAYLISQGADVIPPVADIGFMACPAMFFLSSIAPVHHVRHTDGRLHTGDMLYLLVPYVPLMITGLFIFVGTATGVRLNPVEIYAGLAVVLLVIVRQLVTLMENVRLVDELRISREQLRHEALHDPLTGVANRVLFRERLTNALGVRDRDRPLVLLFIDVDGFKAVNDSYGHAEGDAVLRNVAKRLTHCLRAQDTVARLGGDEFGVLVDGADPDELGGRVLEALRSPHQVHGRRHEVHASIGAAQQATYDPGCTADDMLGSADAAMYTAKRLGKGMVVVHGSPLQELT